MPPRRHNKGPAVLTEAHASEASLTNRFCLEIPHYIGPQDDQCLACGAYRWKLERRLKDAKLARASYSNCCQQGAVELPMKYFPEDVGQEVPDFYRALLTGTDATSVLFRSQIQKYNNALSFTSLGAKVDKSVAGQLGTYTFRISGQMSHNIGSLMPPPNEVPGFAQIYIYGGNDDLETQFRIHRCRQEIDPRILSMFQRFMNLHNPYAQVFRWASQICNPRDTRTLRIKTLSAPGHDHRRYNRPTANDVAAIVEGNGNIGEKGRDIVLARRNGDLQRISELHTRYFALQYPLLFLYGSQMWDEHYTNPTVENPEGDCSNLEWFAYLLFKRPSFSVILASARLFQEFAVDMYVCVEHSRLQFLRYHQKEIRAELYNGIVEALGNELEDEVVGQRIVLPSSFTGGPRHLQQLYQDAMSLVAEYGNPSLFITMTANPEWTEIQEALEEGQTVQDRPDLVARVFYMKYHAMLDDVTKFERFGKFVAYVYTIEFQKRGLPHAHLILFLDQTSRPTTPEQVDCLISAQLPDPVNDPILFRAVTGFMLHGPCEQYKCWNGTSCRLGYPREFSEETELPENTYPSYKRPDNGRHFIKAEFRYHNGHVVPHNRYLLLKYNCHINVEAAVSIRAIKYLFKYILKGHDRTVAGVEDEEQPDEILSYVNARFLSAPEAVWRLLKYPLSGRYPPVQRLNLHLEDSQTVYFLNAQGLRQAVDSGRAERTTLTEFFRLCQENVGLRGSNQTIRSIKYHQVPKYFVWNKKEKRLTPRQNALVSIGRIYFANVKRGDIYYLRVLLAHVPGPTSFEYLRTVDGVIYSTFREAADWLGLLLGDHHYHQSLTEAAVWKTGRQLRHMFAIILCHSPPANPMLLWTDHASNLSDDCEREIRRLNPNIRPTEGEILNYGLHLLEQVLIGMESSLEVVGLQPVDQALLLNLRLIDGTGANRTTRVAPEESSRKYLAMLQASTDEQRAVIDSVCHSIIGQQPYLAFLDGPGGTGKTFTLNTLLHFCNAHHINFQAVSASGIASLLLLHGRTAHTAFKIPIIIDEESVCSISPREALGRRIRDAQFIVWDEVAMQHRHAIEAVDRTIRDLTGINQPFGGKVVLFAGDFRQILPVVRRSTLFEQAAATLKASHLWAFVHRFALTVNIRLGGANARPDPINMNFARWLLDLGSGRLQNEHSANVPIRHCNVTVVPPPCICPPDTIDNEYGAAADLINYRDWDTLTTLYSSRCVITPLNATVQMVNDHVLDLLPGQYHTSTSIDTMDEAFLDQVTPQVLNSFDFPGFPAHTLKIKVGAPFMLLRNLNLGDGLCNGTRLLVTHCGRNTLQCRILTGEMKGTIRSLPKIKLHHDGNQDCPIPFYRYQFLLMPALCMTINKSQGQSLERVTVLLPNPVFAHGQLYVGLSRCTTAANVQVCITSQLGEPSTKNIVFHPILLD